MSDPAASPMVVDRVATRLEPLRTMCTSTDTANPSHLVVNCPATVSSSLRAADIGATASVSALEAKVVQRVDRISQRLDLLDCDRRCIELADTEGVPRLPQPLPARRSRHSPRRCGG